MSFEPNELETVNVVRLPADRQYSYMVGKAVDWLEVWSCRDNSGWIVSSHDGRECIPIWPAQAYAKKCCTGQWATAIPQVISLGDLLDKWLPGMAHDNRLVAIMPSPAGKMIVVEPMVFMRDLQKRLQGS